MDQRIERAYLRAADPNYYCERLPVAGTPLNALAENWVERGHCRRTARARGCE